MTALLWIFLGWLLAAMWYNLNAYLNRPRTYLIDVAVQHITAAADPQATSASVSLNLIQAIENLQYLKRTLAA